MDGMDSNGLNTFSHVLTGYVGSESFLTQISQEVTRLKHINPDLRYHCDPVLGDHNEFDVPESLLEVYRNKVLPIADVITPNDFEVRKLTGLSCDTLHNTIEALDMLHDMGPETVILSSIPSMDEPGGFLTMICSIRLKNGARKRLKIDFPKLDSSVGFTGTGDLFSALCLAWSSICGLDNIDEACERAVSTVHQVLTLTMECKSTLSMPNGDYATVNCSKCVPPELKLIASKSYIEEGRILFKSKAIL